MHSEKEDLNTQIVDTDILILGGGLAGCMAAIRARRQDVGVVIVEKAAIRRSGCAGAGLDHYAEIAHPRINGITAEAYGREKAEVMAGIVSTKLSVITAKDALKPALVLEDIGVKLREDDGTLKMVGTTTKGAVEGQGQPSGTDLNQASMDVDTILYRGADLKLKLAAEVRRRGVRVFDRTMVTSLLTGDDSVVGATAVNVRTGSFLVFKAKAVIMATGGMMARMYEYPFATFPGSLFTVIDCASNSGDGAAIAYRAGAQITNLEFLGLEPAVFGLPYSPPGVLFCVKIKNSKGEELHTKYAGIRETKDTGSYYPWTKYCYMPTTEAPEIERDVLSYSSDEGIPEEAEWYDAFMAASETPGRVSSTLQRGGIRKAPYEIFPWIGGPPCELSGVLRDETGETSLKGLFVAGDAGGALPMYGATGAFVWAYRIGDYLAERVSDAKSTDLGPEQWSQIETEKKRVMAPLGRKDGVDPLELEDLVRKLTTHYVGTKKIEARLKRGLELIRDLKDRFVPALAAQNPHQLMRALEIQNIIDISELHTYASLLRTESRLAPHHYRIDYPEMDDAHWRKNIMLRQVDGSTQVSLETLD